MLIDIENKILENKNDLIEGTFIYKLHEEACFDEELFIGLITDIDAYLDDVSENADLPTISFWNFLEWFFFGVMQLIKSHYDHNDSYKIVNFDKDKWDTIYEPLLVKLLNKALCFRR